MQTEPVNGWSRCSDMCFGFFDKYTSCTCKQKPDIFRCTRSIRDKLGFVAEILISFILCLLYGFDFATNIEIHFQRKVDEKTLKTEYFNTVLCSLSILFLFILLHTKMSVLVASVYNFLLLRTFYVSVLFTIYSIWQYVCTVYVSELNI